jgi:hypothetical protein
LKYTYSAVFEPEMRLFDEAANIARDRLPEIEIIREADDATLSVETIFQVYSSILDIFFADAIHLVAAFRSNRRTHFDDLVKYRQCYEEYAQDMAESLMGPIKEVLNLTNIPETTWVQSVDDQVNKGHKEIDTLVRDYISVFEKKRIPSKKITVEQFKEMLTVFCDALESDVENVKAIANVEKPDRIARIRLYRAWDAVYFATGLEQEDMSGMQPEATQELREIKGRYYMTLNKLKNQ